MNNNENDNKTKSCSGMIKLKIIQLILTQKIFLMMFIVGKHSYKNLESQI